MTHIWYLDDLARLAYEKDVIEELRTSIDWLIGTSWSIPTNMVVPMGRYVWNGGRSR